MGPSRACTLLTRGLEKVWIPLNPGEEHWKSVVVRPVVGGEIVALAALGIQLTVRRPALFDARRRKVTRYVG
jgi:hypothetical protein